MTTYNINPDIDNYCVMGNPVSHSKSPLIHSEFAKQTGQELYYQAIEVDTDGFARAVNEFRTEGGMGLNVTVPFKEEACRISDKLTPRANHAGAVNTIWFEQNNTICFGDNTDGIGLIRDLTINNDIDLAGLDILVLGAGGAVRGILGPLLNESPSRVVIANRTLARAQTLVELFLTHGDISAVEYSSLPGQSFDLVINGTSLGLKGEIPPLPEGLLKDQASCYDLAYAKGDTAFVSWALQQGAGKAVDGIGMLVEQAAESFYIWRGVMPKTVPVISLLKMKMA
ncbi:MAG TPA: shikimate dehydrogenase [Gammaproteobacteria bacterium]